MEWTLRPPDRDDEVTPEQEAYEKRIQANRRAHCSCGRFVRAGSIRRVYNGPAGYFLTWECSQCGTVYD